MRKNLVKGMTALCICAAFASCSKDAGFETASNPAELAKIQYKEAFIKKYGEVDPNQSWDFSNYAITTRGETLPALTWEQEQYGGGTGAASKTAFLKKIKEDYLEVKSKVATTAAEAFPYTYSSMKLRPAFAHGNTNKYSYFSISAEYTYNGQTGKSNDDIVINALYDSSNEQGIWYAMQASYVKNGTSDLNFNTWRNINTIPCINANTARWKVGYGVAQDELTEKTLTTCKMFTVNNRNYIAFDCDGNGDYSDIICLYELLEFRQKEDPKVYAKRYMVEDLGSIGDFDFNDIVFDVIQAADGTQKCYVRALGGTYNITITVGNATWTKDGSEITLGDETVTAEEGVMYNTKPIHSDWILAEFPVSGWDPTGNDVSVTVFTRGQNGEFYTNTIEFPENGDVPMMVAVSTSKVWMPEYKSISDMKSDFINDNVYVLSGE